MGGAKAFTDHRMKINPEDPDTVSFRIQLLTAQMPACCTIAKAWKKLLRQPGAVLRRCVEETLQHQSFQVNMTPVQLGVANRISSAAV